MKNALPKYVYAKPGGGVYFQRRGFKTVRFQSAPGTPEFAAEYALILRGRAPAPQGKTLRDLAISYQQSDRYTKLSARSKQDYNRVLDYIKDKLGHLSAERMQRKDVIRAQESNRDAVRFANYIVQVVRVMMEHAIDIGWRKDNPAEGTRLIKSEAAPRLPWPQDKIDAFRAEAQLGTRHRLIFELLIGTGQRIGDVLRMRWNDISDGGISVRQGKTGAALWIPLTADLRAALEATPKAGLTICAQQNGQPTSYDGAWGMMMVIRKRIGAEAFDIHGLRYNAASEIAATGLSDEHIAAITGHTTRAMIHKYSGAARQKARAIEAQKGRHNGPKDPR